MKCKEAISAYLDTLKDNASCKELPNNRLSVVLPFLYHDHDNVEIFIRDLGEKGVVVSDLGETLRRLDTIGLDVHTSGRLAFQTERIAGGFSVTIQNGVLLKTGAHQDVGALISDVSSVCMAIGDLAYTSKAYRPLTFGDEVQHLLTINDFEFERNHKLKGASTTEYTVDFQVTTQSRVSLVQTLGATTQSGVIKWVNQTYRMWNDTQTGEVVVKRVSLLNDEMAQVRPQDEKLLETVSSVYHWSKRKEFLDFLRNGGTKLRT